MKYYVAYGSNLNRRQMAFRCPDARPVATALIKDHRLVFRGNARGTGVATVEPESGCKVPVGIWTISPRDEKALDRYEGFPWLYDKKTITMDLEGVKIEAMIYIMTEGHQVAAPSGGYVSTIAEGYRDFGFDLKPLMEAVVDTDPSRRGVS